MTIQFQETLETKQSVNLFSTYKLLKSEIEKSLYNKSIDNNTYLTDFHELDVILIGKNYNYTEQLPKNLVIDKIPDDNKSINYIIVNKSSSGFLKKTVVSFNGSDNILFIGNGSQIGNGEIRFYNSCGLVVLNSYNIHKNWFRVWLHSPTSWVYWGKNATSNGVICVTNDSKGIFVGDDCMFASNTWIRCSDMHDIFDINSYKIINESANVLIDSHVWVAQESLILKGAKIGMGSIIGARSLVAGEIPNFSLAIGSPAKVVKQDVCWYRNKSETTREKTRLLVQEKSNK